MGAAAQQVKVSCHGHFDMWTHCTNIHHVYTHSCIHMYTLVALVVCVYTAYLHVLFPYFLVEFSFTHVHVEDSTSPELWKHCGHQTSGADPSHGPPHWIAHQRGLHVEWN